MWYNRSGCLTNSGDSLLELFNKPKVQNGVVAVAVFCSIYAAVPAPKHDENKSAPQEETAVVETVVYNPDGEAHQGTGAHEPVHEHQAHQGEGHNPGVITIHPLDDSAAGRTLHDRASCHFVPDTKGCEENYDRAHHQPTHQPAKQGHEPAPHEPGHH